MGEPEQASRVVRFGVFEADFRTAELRKYGVRIRLAGQAFQVLEALLDRPGDLVTRAELKQRLWPTASFGDFEHGLNAAVNRLREALGDSSENPRFIETLPRRGYRLIAPVAGASPRAAAETGEVSPVVPISGPETAQSARPKASAEPNRWRLWAAMGILLLAAIVAGGWILAGSPARRARTAQAPPPASSNMRISRLTDLPGTACCAALSPDAKFVAFFWNGVELTKRDLFVQLVGGEKPLRLTRASSAYICCAQWTPDGREVSFSRCEDKDKRVGGVFVIPALGGPERRIADIACWWGVAGAASWTADGRSLVLFDRCVPKGPTGIVVLSLETGVRRCLSVPATDDLVDSEPVLSPDQETVAFKRGNLSFSTTDLYTVPLAGGEVRRLTYENKNLGGLMWAVDGRHICFYSDRAGLARTWRVPVGGGAIEPETTYPKLGTFSKDGRRLVYSEGSAMYSAWRADLDRAGGTVLRTKPIFSASYRDTNVQLSSDGRQVVFTSFRTGQAEIWKSSADGSDPLRLTSFRGFAGSPRWSPDDRSIAFDYRQGMHGQIFLMDAEGRNQHAITSGNYENIVPTWSRDGAFLYYTSNRTGEDRLWKRELATGQDTQVTHHAGLDAAESVDRKTLYFSKLEGGGIWSLPVAGGEERQITPLLQQGYWGYFAVTDAGLYLVDAEEKGGPTIKFYDFRSRQLRPVLPLKQQVEMWFPNFSASRDGRTVLFGEVDRKSSLILVDYSPAEGTASASGLP